MGDGSTDDIQKIVASYGEQVRYIWQENQGLTAAHKTILRSARSEHIGLLDPDDLYQPAILDTLISVLK